MTGDAGLGDVIRAWRALGAVTDDERRAIARLLGFDLGEVAAAEEEPPPPRPPDRRDPDQDGPRPRFTGERVSDSADKPGDPIQLVQALSVDDNRIPIPEERLPRPAEAAEAPLESLFAATWERAIASSLVARQAAAGAIDVERIIGAFARQEPVRTLPRMPRQVSATEIAVVLDDRGTIPWLRRDAVQLVERLDAVTRAPVTLVQSDGAPVLAAAGTPATAQSGRTRARSRGPTEVHVSPGGRVVGVTDLGLGSPWLPGDPARATAWADLALELRSRGATLVIVTPVPLARIPAALSRLAPCVHWDAATRPGNVHRLLKGMR